MHAADAALTVLRLCVSWGPRHSVGAGAVADGQVHGFNGCGRFRMLVSLVPTPELDLSKRIRGLRGGDCCRPPYRGAGMKSPIETFVARPDHRLDRPLLRTLGLLAGQLPRRRRRPGGWGFTDPTDPDRVTLERAHRLALRRVVRRQPIRGVEQHHLAGTLRTTTHHPVLHWWHDHSPVQSSRGSVGRASTIFIVSTDTRVTRLIKSTM